MFSGGEVACMEPEKSGSVGNHPYTVRGNNLPNDNTAHSGSCSPAGSAILNASNRKENNSLCSLRIKTAMTSHIHTEDAADICDKSPIAILSSAPTMTKIENTSGNDRDVSGVNNNNSDVLKKEEVIRTDVTVKNKNEDDTCETPADGGVENNNIRGIARIESSLHRAANKLREKLTQTGGDDDEGEENGDDDEECDERVRIRDDEKSLDAANDGVVVSSDLIESSVVATSASIAVKTGAPASIPSQRKPVESGRSQYHSIQQLSSPSSRTTSSGAAEEAAAAIGGAYDYTMSHRGNCPPTYDNDVTVRHFYDASRRQGVVPPPTGDALDVLRGLINGDAFCAGNGTSLRDKLLAEYSASAGDHDRRGQRFEDERYGSCDGSADDEDDDDDDDERSYRSSSRRSSLSVDDFSDRDNDDAGRHRRDVTCDDEIRNDHEEDEVEMTRNTTTLTGNVFSIRPTVGESNGLGERLEAKKARVENIISHMRFSPTSKFVDASGDIIPNKRNAEDNGSVINRNGDYKIMEGDVLFPSYSESKLLSDQLVARQRSKRKQYIPQQHDSGRYSDDGDQSEEPPAAKVYKIEKDSLQQELQQMHDQLADMQHKYLLMFDPDDVTNAADGFKTTLAERLTAGIMADINRNEMQPISGYLLRSLQEHHERQKYLMTASRDEGGDGEVRNEREGQDGEERPNNVEHLAKMLKAEITKSLGILVDGIVKSFVSKHFQQRNKEDEKTKDNIATNSHSPPPSRSSTNKAGVFPGHKDHNQHNFNSFSSPLKSSKELLSPVAGSNVRPSAQTSSLIPSALLLPPPPTNVQPMHPAFPPNHATPVSISDAFSPFRQHGREKPLADKYLNPYNFDFRGSSKSIFDISAAAAAATAAHNMALFGPAPHPHHPFFSSSVAAAAAAAAKLQPLFAKEPEQTEALPLVVNTPKKKRTKVTDTRLSPRAARAMLQESLHHHQQQTHHHHHHHPTHHVTASHHPHQSPQQQMQNHHRQQQLADWAEMESKSFQRHHPYRHGALSGGIHDAFSLPPSVLAAGGLPTSVAIHNPSLQHSGILQAMYSQHAMAAAGCRESGATSFQQLRSVGQQREQQREHQLQQQQHRKRSLSNSSDLNNKTPKSEAEAFDLMMSEMNYDGQNMTSTLTPMHLRKAKLMFFYVRYPSSAILKLYFPDVKFNKNNTAQLVKWFSNFREFFYIQMEKYARQAMAEGVQNVTDLVVTIDSELYRILVLHYNRNNQIEVPENFRFTVQAALREFFLSISAEKDQEQSWKKAIYKVIARMDDTAPEYFKSTNWMEQLADG